MKDTGKLSKQLEKLPASGLRLEIKPAKKILWLYVFFILCLCGAIMILQLSNIHKTALLCFCVPVTIKILRQHVLFTHPHAVASLVVTELGWCFVQLNNGHIERLSILSQSCLTSGLLVLSLGYQQAGIQWQTRSLVLTAEMVSPEKFRQFKRHLIINRPSLRLDT